MAWWGCCGTSPCRLGQVPGHFPQPGASFDLPRARHAWHPLDAWLQGEGLGMGPALHRAWLCVTCVPTTVRTAQPSADRMGPPRRPHPEMVPALEDTSNPTPGLLLTQITDGSRTTAPRLSAGGAKFTHTPGCHEGLTRGLPAPPACPSAVCGGGHCHCTSRDGPRVAEWPRH